MPPENQIVPRGLRGHWRTLTIAQRHAFTACFLGWALDAFDYFLLVFCIPSISSTFHVGTAAVAEALFLTLAFRPVGAFLFGLLAERYGRRPTLTLNIACYAALELACAFAPSLHGLLLLRALFGIAMGGEWGVGAALAFETLPARGRGFFSGILQEGYAAGYLLASVVFGLCYPPLVSLAVHFHLSSVAGTPATSFAWRGLFLLGALPGLLSIYIWRKVPESPIWLANRQNSPVPTVHAQPLHNAPAGRLVPARGSVGVWLRTYGGTFLFLILLMAGFNAFSHGTQDLYPTFLLRNHHATPHEVGAIGVLYNIGAILGGILFGTLSEKWGRKRTIITAALLALPCIPLYALAPSLPLLACGAFLMQFMVQGAWGVVPAYLSELSPGPLRAVFPGLAYQLGNLLTSRNSVLQAQAAVHYGVHGSLAPVLAVTVLMVAIYLAVITSFGRESRGNVLS
jgi:SHS family lactate transporter-like MFS transporter